MSSKAFVEAMPVAAFECSGHGQICSINQEARRLLGLHLDPKSEPNPKSFLDFDGKPLESNGWAPCQALKSPLPVSQMVKYLCPTGEVLYLELIAKALSSESVICVLTDRSRQKTLEQFHQIAMATSNQTIQDQLWNKEDQLEALINAIPDFLFVVGRTGTIHTFHVDQVDALYMPPEVFLGKKIQDLLPEGLGIRALATIEAACISGNIHDLEYHLPMPDGIHSYAARVRRINPETVIILSRDITQAKAQAQHQKELEQQLTRIQKLEALGSLAGGVAHDMNNVLSAILGMATACQSELAPSESMAHRMSIVAKACERGRSMVKGLMDFAKRDLAQTQSINLNQLLEEARGLLSRTTLQRIQVKCELDPELRTILGDASAITHAIMNLCINAVDAMPDGGSLTLQTRNCPSGEVLVSIEDTGIGMSEEVLEKALSPFFTTKPFGSGTGLGLSSTYGTLKAHGGRMDLQSKPGQGTQAHLFFPSQAKPVTPTQTAPSTPKGEKAKAPSLNVLIIDDDELIQSSMKTVLNVLGSTAHVASRGEEAIQMLSDGLTVDLVILDMNMPGLGGAETLPRLRALRPQLPVLLATGRADQKAKSLVEGYPDVTLLPKPFGLSELREQLARVAAC